MKTHFNKYKNIFYIKILYLKSGTCEKINGKSDSFKSESVKIHIFFFFNGEYVVF